MLGEAGMRVLVVEDDAQVRVLAEALLEEDGHETLSAATIDEALALLDNEDRIDLLFTDLGLHDDLQAGLTLAVEARKRKPNLAVLYTTGQGVTDGMKALFVEPYVFLAKPYTPDQLKVAIQNLETGTEPRS
jgi:DNA-binding NtrC family response regulator